VFVDFNVDETRKGIQMRKRGWTDEMQIAAIKIQTQYRAYRARIYFNNIMKATKIMKNAEDKHLNEPTNRVAQYNYALYQLAIINNPEQTRHLWTGLFNKMVEVY